MFELTGEDISRLNDKDLRTLVAKLCEAELRRVGLPVSALTAGGDQNAPDGGIDVRIALPHHDKATDFIPRPDTGFQVKVPDMPEGAITAEMCPKGVLRPVIQELARKHGAYVIVSSHGSTADAPLRNRITAMQDAAKSVPALPDLHVDFYDRNRLATWVNQYAGVAAWVQKQLGKPMSGWQSYGNWSGHPNQIDTGYISDATCRMYDTRSAKAGSLTVETGIARIREVLANPGGVVRLIGLSGVGKTRLVEALFDDRVLKNALSQAWVVYTDIAHEPTPPPRDRIHRFIQERQRAIVVVDNCPPAAHRNLVQVTSVPDSPVSLLTVEYDVGEDEPEGTEVFRLEAASEEVIEQLVERVAPGISQVDRRRISEFSGGNARIALALIRTIDRHESVAHLSDKDLFERLFHQRHSESDTLLRAGEACALVYSFDGETTEGPDAELPILAQLADLSVNQLHRHVQELKKRELIQQRSTWRALLPHALANKLAQSALEHIPPATLTKVMVDTAPERLLRSFSRRLGYLHNCHEAQRIVGTWLAEGGLLGNVATLSPLQWDMFHNVAPVLPEAALAAMERAFASHDALMIVDLHNPYRHEWTSLLSKLAFDAALFDRAAGLLARFVIAEPQGHNNSSNEQFTGLFKLHLSGTYASVQQRLQVVDTLLRATKIRTKQVGLDALNSMLEAWHFSSICLFEFGARPRDFGWHPKNYSEAAGWYHAVLSFISERMVADDNLAGQLASIVANRFCGLWVKARMYDELESLATKLAEKGSWIEGWVSIRRTLKYHASKMPEDTLKRLQHLEATLRPTELLEQARAYVLLPQSLAFDIVEAEGEDGEEYDYDALRKADDRAEELGRIIASRPEVLGQLLVDLVRGREAGRRWHFGVGLATASADMDAMWQTLTSAFRSVPEQERNTFVLRGFLAGASRHAADKVAAFLDAAVTDPVLGQHFLYLQCAVTIDEQGLQRLFEALRVNLAPIETFRCLPENMMTNTISPTNLQRFLLELAARPDGTVIAIHIWSMQFCILDGKKRIVTPELIRCGRDLLMRYDFKNVNTHDECDFAAIFRECLTEIDSDTFVQAMCHTLNEAISNEVESSYYYSEIIEELFITSPSIALNTFMLQGNEKIAEIVVHCRWEHDAYPLEKVPLNTLLDWASEEPQARFPAMASATPLFTNPPDQAAKLSPLALSLIDAAPDKGTMLDCFQRNSTPDNWLNPFAPSLDECRAALAPLMNHPEPVVASRAREWSQELAREAEQERLRERKRDERFE